ncbi:MAG: hypothetical protein ACK46X_05045 [Candidatus Sericytochromatia bacterium]
MPKVQRTQVVATLTDAYGADSAEAALASALAEAGLSDAPAFEAEDVARLGRALIDRAARLAAESPAG